jgi:hypothetical protein
MKHCYDVRRLLQWYPPSWRARYEDEFLVFLEDRLEDSPLTLRFRMSVAVAGLRERSYGSGMVGTRSSPSTQRRTGSLMVLVAWSIMMIGGASLVKTAEHFSAALPAQSRAVTQFAYTATAVAGAVGTLLVIAGAFVALPGVVRFLRAKKWSEVRRVFVISLVASAALVITTFGLSFWAHHLTTAQRNGADDAYSGVFAAFVVLAVVTIGLWTRASVAVALRINFSPRELRWASGLAIGASLSSILVVVSATIWWIQMGLHAPWFLQGTAPGITTSAWSANLVVTMFVLVLGTLSALWGASRVALTYWPTRFDVH